MGNTKMMVFNYPKGVYFCIFNEFTERFAIYGIQAILTFYLLDRYEMTRPMATVAYHAFICFSYFTPILGSTWADGFLGPFKVVLYLSLLYCLGPLLLIGSSFSYETLGDNFLKILGFLGLFIVALCSGGRKPCVSAFAADQFPSTMVKERQQFFSTFYFMTYSSAVLAQLSIPALKGAVECMGQDTCYPLAYGTIAFSIFIAAIIFISGKSYYKIEAKRHENVIWLACKCICHAMLITCQKWTNREQCQSKVCCHWLDRSIPKFGEKLVQDVKGAMKLSIIFLPFIPFWALYFQIGSTFVMQGRLMNGRLGQLTILPDMMAMLSSIFVLILVLAKQSIIYPFLIKCNIQPTPLKRMGCGIMCIIASFIIAGFIQMNLDSNAIIYPRADHSRHTFLNLAPCQVNAKYANLTITSDQLISVDLNHSTNNSSVFDYENCSSSLSVTENLHRTLSFDNLNRTTGKFVVIWQKNLEFTELFYPLKKTSEGYSKVYFTMEPSIDLSNSSIVIKQGESIKEKFSINKNMAQKYGYHIHLRAPPLYGSNVFQIHLENCSSNFDCDLQFLTNFEALTGSSHVLIVTSSLRTYLVPLIEPYQVNLIWQTPQYCLIAAADTLVSIAGVEFSYTQASPRMKSMLQGVRLMTTMMGNLLEMALSASGLIENDPILEFFGWSAFMTLAFIAFCILAGRYKYVNMDSVMVTFSTEGQEKSISKFENLSTKF